MVESSPPQFSLSQPENSDKERGRSLSRKRQLSNSDELMKPPATRQRSLSVSRKSNIDQELVTFKTQGQTFNMSKLVETTFLKPDIFDNVITKVMSNIKDDLLSEISKTMKCVVTEAVEDAVKPLHELIKRQDQRIMKLETENQTLKKEYESKIESVEALYEKFRNIANAHSTLLTQNQQLNTEITLLNSKIEELEQYGRRTSLRFHNVPLAAAGMLSQTDDVIVKLVNDRLKINPPLCENDINRSHIIGKVNDGKGQLTCRFRNWKIKNSVYMAKRNLYGNPDHIFITEDLTQLRQGIIKELGNSTKSLIKSVDDIHTLIESE